MMSGVSAAGVPITEKGEARAVIVHNGHTNVATQIPANPLGVSRKFAIKPAAVELRDYLKEITGAELPLVATLAEAGDRPAIVLEVVEKVPGASDRETGRQAYRLKTDGNRLVITVADELGLHNAVYGLLEDHFGCHFYTCKRIHGSQGVVHYDGPDFEVVPRRPTLTLNGIDNLQEPSLANRGLIFAMGSYPWVLKNRAIGHGGDHVSGARAAGHTMYSWIPPEDLVVWLPVGGRTNRPGLFKDHPEIYPQFKDGKRAPDKYNMGICGTAATLPPILAESFTKGQPTNSEALLAVGQGDGFLGCQCPECRKLVQAEQSEAAPLILALSRALEIAGKTHPKLKVITFSYFDTLDAPKTLRPHSNLWINVVSSDQSKNPAGDQMGPILNNPANRSYARALREWPKIAPGRVTVWHWDTYSMGSEWPSMFYVAGNLRYMRDCGVYGVNPQTCGGAWNEMLNWLYMKLAWNIDADADALIRQYLADNFSAAAAPHLWEYLKLGQAAYEDSLYVPSAVRWTGWARMTNEKLFHPSVRTRMVAAMDRAQAAAEREGTPAQVANLLAARDRSLDRVVVEAARYAGQGWGVVPYARDRRQWYVPGACADVPAVIERRKRAQPNLPAVARLARGAGGPLVELAGSTLTASVCPDLAGQVIGAVDRKTGRELLDAHGPQAGYSDLLGNAPAQIWLPLGGDEKGGRAALDRPDAEWATLWSDFRPPRSGDQLRTETILSPVVLNASNYLHRTVMLTDAGLQIERSYTGILPGTNGIGAKWRLALPEPGKSAVSVRGGGISQFMDLRYAEPGGIRFVKAGQRPAGLDAMDEAWDTVIAVSDAAVTDLPLKSADGELTVELNRGDGTAVTLKTPAAGWRAVQIKPAVGEHLLEVTLLGAAATAGTGTVQTLALASQTFAAHPVAPGVAVAKADDRAQPRLRITGTNTAINEIDGAELVWIPAGRFLRGSPAGIGGGDERPQKQVELDGYWIYKHPVTLGQFLKYRESAGKPFTPPWGQAMHAEPAGDTNSYAAQANWHQCREFAVWAGGDLPTEAQWEKAARGTDGREYPWGNDWDPEKCVSIQTTVNRFNEGFRPVGSHPQGTSPYGVEDMAGNTWEWVRDWYDYEYYRTAPDRNPTGPETGSLKVMRGGSSLFDERFCRSAARMVQPPEAADWTPIGFRCVVNAAGPEVGK
jgi:formylglycine-generating enzyme required for sulfatase activity